MFKFPMQTASQAKLAQLTAFAANAKEKSMQTVCKNSQGESENANFAVRLILASFSRKISRRKTRLVTIIYTRLPRDFHRRIARALRRLAA